MDQAQLREWEARCTQEEPPRCQAACPLRVDARALCGFLAQGRVNEAWAVLCRSMPLPGVLARICDAPCQGFCLRRERGGAVEIAALERSCAGQATRSPRLIPLPARGEPVLVLGGGMAALACAWDLARKGFSVTLRAAAPGAALLARFPDRLDQGVLDRELEAMARLGVVFQARDAAGLDPAGLDPALAGFGAAFVDPALAPAAALGLESDPLSLATSRPGLFAALAAPESPVFAAALGRRAASSLERWLQGASLTSTREHEGACATRLSTPLEGVADAAPIPVPAQGYAPDAARDEAGRCLDCQCLRCVRHCAYLEHFGSYPRVYARRVFNNEAIVMGSRQANILINSCMLCGLCEKLCPEGFDMAELCLTARRGMVEQGRMPASAHEFALRDMAQASGARCALARHAPGQGTSAQALFPGCQLGASDPGALERLFALARERLPGGTGLLLRCCGAPARWAGREALFSGNLAALAADWEALGRPEILAACPSCRKILAEALPPARVRSLWEALAAAGAPALAASPGPALALHDPCAAREDPAQRQAVRALLRGLGRDLAEPALSGEFTECCGFGGLLAEANPPLAEEVIRRRARAASEDFVTYCAMCRDRLAKAGKRALHLADLLCPGPGDPAARPAPGHSARRENRERLAERLKATLWGEAGAAPEPWEAVAVEFTPEAAARLEERRILRSDVQKALLAAEASGRWLLHPQSGLRLASLRPREVTYWVECLPRPGGGYLVSNAWSHRMRVAGGGRP